MTELDSHKAIVAEFNKIWQEQESKWKELFENRQMTTTGDNRYWHDREHIRFLVCIKFLKATKCSGLPVKQIAMYIYTRNGIQVRTHAQKYFKNIRELKPDEEEKVNLLLERDKYLLQNLFSQQKKTHIKKSKL
ncbi:Myb family DNA-binding protein, SHAQKYF family protein [Entamoeba histolytica HM-1:IMSS-B]|uniref:Myb family DNA-binding protein shaqkyf family n=6 Tax=Entamoeba histolytica TaxID=5759 RepID=C4LY63_ENTH1|nr:hypothetical protein EHI_051440 [Entamoeba histolytica HM-1:IMSS]EMD43345.1 Hypothetical protein EHI5A_053520 [Entamoeba histolytica KU27]EMH75642.1 Myb family DNA-binding protein, SHAQKYF family protein [Entamoeba histolytica HM-1:IMSS-B]EMS17748.1 hypothetical protein KM1_075100 [Entamoeba histolytica HM-3:IMSS]ENY60708.1 hypothetical protein EHI7A_038530 [Entamoeba histolytica HM-1:IMSS-A]GAT93730.1 hypothetical protein CL6EHI_051440 [Entamoeba histolytica]|eukprot:XP_651291.1 hypothetical protein EHI_051440 [Entamoeba histolytica HM-1:IMSS]